MVCIEDSCNHYRCRAALAEGSGCPGSGAVDSGTLRSGKQGQQQVTQMGSPLGQKLRVVRVESQWDTK
ncbi:hypothetical protein GCM10008955_40880 [Deinococcus malanensis]|uniref:Uncharacterized protein n=1 Tax=Deinococcus malanensis TaxID=1706855 RepID=A0ABQ2F2H6_9DEIO|nr:hypothetical protein GCM10008955_40880 [Deinococcus malanensis]